MKTPFDFTPADFTQPDRRRAQCVARAYLIALALSPYSYHLDDKLETILWDRPVTRAQTAHLKDMMFHVNALLSYEERWAVYQAASMANGDTPLVLD